MAFCIFRYTTDNFRVVRAADLVMKLHYNSSSGKRAGEFETRRLAALAENAQQMEARIKTTESILDAENPGWGNHNGISVTQTVPLSDEGVYSGRMCRYCHNYFDVPALDDPHCRGGGNIYRLFLADYHPLYSGWE